MVGKTWREAKRQHDERIADSKTAVTDTLRAFTALGASLLGARNDGVPLEMALTKSAEWHRLDQLVATGAQLSNTLADEPLAHVGQGYHRFRRYAPRMLRCLKLKAAAVAQPLVTAAMAIGEMRASTPAFSSAPVRNGTAKCGRKTGVTTASGSWRSCSTCSVGLLSYPLLKNVVTERMECHALQIGVAIREA